MTTIIVTHENNEMDEFDFPVEIKTITVGRRSTNDVCVPHLSVSGNHCKITISDSGALIEDLNSTNGTYINGRLISRQLLNDGDDIVIGKARLTFLQPEASAAAREANDLRNTGSEVSDSANDFDADEPMSLAAKAALHRQQVGSGVVDSKSEFAGDYYEPDESEIAAMIEPPSDDLDDSFSAEPFDDGAAGEALATKPKETPVQQTGSGRLGDPEGMTHSLDSDTMVDASGAVIQIKNGAKSGQVLPIDKPVTTLGRPGIQIAAIMKKPEGYFLMHIESEDHSDRPKLNDSMIGDDPVLLSSGDSLNVAGIDVQFMLS